MKSALVVAVACALVACGPAAHEAAGASAPERTGTSVSGPSGTASGANVVPPSAAPSPGAAPAAAVVPPVSAATAQKQQGAETYARMCAVCHGASGEGYKADQAPAIGRGEFLASVTDEFLRVAIVDGRKGSTMSAWGKIRGGPLDPGQVDALISFMRGWQTGPALSLDETPLRGHAAVGLKVFEVHCARCHGADGKAATAVRIGNPDWLSHASNGLIRHAVRGGRPGTQMEAFGEKLGDQGVEDVVAYVRGLLVPPPPPEPPPSNHPAPLPLGKVPLHAGGPEPKGFQAHPATTPADVIHAELVRGAKMALLDARAPTDYANEHISGAVSVPFYDPSPYLAKLPKNAWLVSYCACPHAESGDLAAKLVAAGFAKVTVLNEGLGYWKNKGYKTQTGTTQGTP